MEEPKVKGKDIYDTYFTTNAIGLHTCNDCKQVLKQADRRSSLLPETLNMLMILKHNNSFWLTAESIQEILDSDDFRDPEQEQEESDSEEEGEEGL